MPTIAENFFDVIRPSEDLMDANKVRQDGFVTNYEALRTATPDADKAILGPLEDRMNEVDEPRDTWMYDQASAMPPVKAFVHRLLLSRVRSLIDPSVTTVERALEAFRDQMVADGDYLVVTTPFSVVAGAVSGTGTGKVFTLSSDWDVESFQNMFDEKITCTVIKDAQSHNGTKPGSELWACGGENAVEALMDRRWPKGSGGAMQIVTTSGAVNGGSGYGVTRLTNGGFERWGAQGVNIPDNWLVDAGTPGTHFKKSTDPFTGKSCFEAVGDGAATFRLYQPLGSKSGTLGLIDPKRVFSLLYSHKDGATPLATGVLRLSVQDAGWNVQHLMASSFGNGDIGAAWDTDAAFFRAKENVGADLRVVLESTTAIGAAESVKIDDVALNPMSHLGGAGGVPWLGMPLITFARGATNFVIGDTVEVTCENGYAGGLLQAMNELFDMYKLGIFLPTTGSNLIAD